jgi:hypothetical protein
MKSFQAPVVMAFLIAGLLSVLPAPQTVGGAWFASESGAAKAESRPTDGDAPPGRVAPATAPSERSPAQPSPPDSAAEIAFWNSIKDSRRPEEFSAYLEKFPNGAFVPLAKGRLSQLGTYVKIKPSSSAWAAIAFEAGGAWGAAWKKDLPTDAAVFAKAQCLKGNGKKCETVASTDKCIALANGRGAKQSYATTYIADSAGEASDLVLERCREVPAVAANCRRIVVVCADGVLNRIR